MKLSDRIEGAGRVSSRIMGKVERHLGENASDELFAKAMVSICDGFPPDCSHHQTCLHDGECFKSPPDTEAARIIEAAAKRHTGAVQTYLSKAAQEIRAGRIYVGAKVCSIRAREGG